MDKGKGWIDPVKYGEICGILPIVTTDVAVFNNNKLLLLKRIIPPLEGTWCLPGGGIRLGETLVQSASRRLFDETGIITENLIECHHVINYLYPSIAKHNIGIAFVTSVTNETIIMDEQHDAYVWADINNLPEQIDLIMMHQITNCIRTFYDDGWKLNYGI